MRTIITILIAVLAMMGTSFAAGAADTTVTADASVLSAYVARGQVINDALVLQPVLGVTRGGLSIEVWGNMNLTDRITEDAPDFSEVDITISYCGCVGQVELAGGVAEYLFPNSTLIVDEGDGTVGRGTACPGTRELFVKVAVPDLTVVPNITVYREIDEADGTYVTAGLEWAHDFNDKWSISLAGSVAYADKAYNACYFGVDKSGLNDGNAGVEVSWTPVENLTIAPTIQYTTLLDSDIKDAAGAIYKDDESIWGGVKASWEL